jgi:hypothetical protein
MVFEGFETHASERSRERHEKHRSNQATTSIGSGRRPFPEPPPLLSGGNRPKRTLDFHEALARASDPVAFGGVPRIVVRHLPLLGPRPCRPRFYGGSIPVARLACSVAFQVSGFRRPAAS